MGVHIPTLPMPASTATTCGISVVHAGARFPCTGTPTWDVRARIGIGNVEDRLRITGLRSNIGKL